MTKVDKAWIQGYICALTTLLRLEGLVTPEIRELWRSAGIDFNILSEANIDEYDMNILNTHKINLLK